MAVQHGEAKGSIPSFFAMTQPLPYCHQSGNESIKMVSIIVCLSPTTLSSLMLAQWTCADSACSELLSLVIPFSAGAACTCISLHVISICMLGESSSETSHVMAGADDFLPVLIYVVIQANPPALASNLEYIQRFRMQNHMVAEFAYFFTQLV